MRKALAQLGNNLQRYLLPMVCLVLAGDSVWRIVTNRPPLLLHVCALVGVTIVCVAVMSAKQKGVISK